MDRIIEVGVTAPADDHLPQALDELTEHGVLATPIAIGRQGRPEGVLLSVPALAEVATVIGDVQNTQVNPQNLPVTDLGDSANTAAVNGILAPVLDYLAEHGTAAAPVLIGRRGTREAAIVSVALFERIYQAVDEAQIAHTAAQRLGLLDQGDAADAELTALCADFGVDPEAVRDLLARDAENGTDQILVEEPGWNKQ